MRTRLLSLTVLLAGALLAGCGGTTGGDSGDSGAQPEYSASEGSTMSPVEPTGKPAPNLTITGTPTEGVENGCIVMESNGTLYLLLGGERSALMSGRPVKVKGSPNPGLMTTCQQGTPFEVTEVTPA